MTPPTSELCIKRLLDVLKYYVREDLRVEVQRIVVPYVRYGENLQPTMESLAVLQRDGFIRPGFIKLLGDLRKGDHEAECVYDEEFINA